MRQASISWPSTRTAARTRTIFTPSCRDRRDDSRSAGSVRRTPGYYAVFFTDADGIKLEVVFEPELRGHPRNPVNRTARAASAASSHRTAPNSFDRGFLHSQDPNQT
jgi:hypothetical protein